MIVVLSCAVLRAYPPLEASYFFGWNIEPRHDGRSSNLYLKDLPRARLKPVTQWVTNWLATTESGDMVIDESGDMVIDEDRVINLSADIVNLSGDIVNEDGEDIVIDE